MKSWNYSHFARGDQVNSIVERDDKVHVSSRNHNSLNIRDQVPAHCKSILPIYIFNSPIMLMSVFFF